MNEIVIYSETPKDINWSQKLIPAKKFKSDIEKIQAKEKLLMMNHEKRN